MEQKYLPIGSVCTLKGKNKKVMITGYYSVEFNGNLKINDYMGCAYPEGMLLPELSCTFNHTDIEKIDFIGFKNEEQETFKGLLNRLTGNTDVESAAEFHKENDMFLTSNSTYSKLLFDENGVVMIADPVVEPKENKTNNWKDIKFDENGYVISTGNDEDINNPFHKEYAQTEAKEENSTDWKIFNKIEFDENGTVVSTDNNIETKKDEMLNEIQFDENGTVISVKGEDLKQEQSFEQYRFDENGTLISLGNEQIEEDNSNQSQINQPVTSEIKFDENGTVVSIGKTDTQIAAEQPLDGFQFDENGNVIGAPVEQPVHPQSTNIQFDENGTVVSA